MHVVGVIEIIYMTICVFVVTPISMASGNSPPISPQSVYVPGASEPLRLLRPQPDHFQEVYFHPSTIGAYFRSKGIDN